MSTPINSSISQNHVNLVSHQPYITKDSYVSPYLRSNLDIAKIGLYTTPAAAPQTTTVPLHDPRDGETKWSLGKLRSDQP